jgi:hypothetical protein
MSGQQFLSLVVMSLALHVCAAVKWRLAWREHPSTAENDYMADSLSTPAALIHRQFLAFVIDAPVRDHVWAVGR